MDKIDISSIVSGLLPTFGSDSDIEDLVGTKVVDAINFFTGFAALVAVILIIVAGYMFITSSGDPDKVDKAGKTLSGTIVGLIIVFVARLLVEFVLKAVVK